MPYLLVSPVNPENVNAISRRIGDAEPERTAVGQLRVPHSPASCHAFRATSALGQEWISKSVTSAKLLRLASCRRRLWVSCEPQKPTRARREGGAVL